MTVSIAGTTGIITPDATIGTSDLSVTGNAPSYTCRAWVNFDGTGTVSIRESGNVSSITDNGTGIYTVNFTTAMPDANYSGVFGCNDNGNTTSMNYRTNGTKTTTAFQVSTTQASAVIADNNMCMVAIFR